MPYQWGFRAYQRRFKRALQTSHGSWTVREGVLLRLVDNVGNIGWGEVAPLSWFGSETLEQALQFCHRLPNVLTDDLIFVVPDTLPACQFAFESAWKGLQEAAIGQASPQKGRAAENLTALVTESSTLQDQSSDVADQSSDVRVRNSAIAVQSSTLRDQSSIVAVQNSKLQSQNPRPNGRSPSPLSSFSYSALLPAGDVALHTWQPLWEQGFRTFKWKIGVQAIATELKLLNALIQTLPKTAKLRLDANGGLSTDEAAQWLQACDAMIDPLNQAVVLEYIEQPLPIAQFEAMQTLSQHYQTAIALDESVATLPQLQTCYENGWRGIFVIKPAIVGSPTRLRQFCHHHPIDAVFSSAFETAIGRQAGLQLAATLGNPDRALGYGTAHWFEEAESDDFEELWQTL
jgi:O-succinylbenzoate synthase